MGANNLEVRDAMKGVNHVGTLWERIDWQGFRPGLQPTPIGNQLRLSQLGPGLHQSSLSPGQTPSEQLYGVKAIHGLIVAVVGVKMGRVMRPEFAVHANDDSVKATELSITT